MLPRPQRRPRRRHVGELANAACWSHQGRKTITASEGGILTTPHREVYEKAPLLGHFIQRALAEVRTQSPLYRLAETGFGLKYRAHPLGLAMAEAHLQRLDNWLLARQRHAACPEDLPADRAGINVLTRPAAIGPRHPLHVAEQLAATSLRVHVSADDGPEGRAYIDAAIDTLDRALNSLSAPPGRTTLPA